MNQGPASEPKLITRGSSPRTLANAHFPFRPCQRLRNQSQPIAYFENDWPGDRLAYFISLLPFNVLFREWMAPIVRFIFWAINAAFIPEFSSTSN